MVKFVHVVKRLSIQPKNSLHAVHHGIKVVSNAKPVSSFHWHFASHHFISGNSGLTLATYKDFQKDVYCKSRFEILCTYFDVKFLFSVSLGCYQDKLHPHERNRKQLEGKFSRQPAAAAAASAAPAATGDEE